MRTKIELPTMCFCCDRNDETNPYLRQISESELAEIGRSHVYFIKVVDLGEEQKRSEEWIPDQETGGNIHVVTTSCIKRTRCDYCEAPFTQWLSFQTHKKKKNAWSSHDNQLSPDDLPNLLTCDKMNEALQQLELTDDEFRGIVMPAFLEKNYGQSHAALVRLDSKIFFRQRWKSDCHNPRDIIKLINQRLGLDS